MKDGQYDEAIMMFSNHFRALMSKKELCLHEKSKMTALESRLGLVARYLQDLRQSSLNQSLNSGQIPVTDYLEEALEFYEPVVKATIRRIVTYPLPGVTWENTVGLQGAKDALNRCLLSPLQSGSLYESEESKSTGRK